MKVTSFKRKRSSAGVSPVPDSWPVDGKEREKEKTRQRNNEGKLSLSLSLQLVPGAWNGLARV